MPDEMGAGIKACKFDIKNRPQFHHTNAVGLFHLCRPEDEQSRMNKVVASKM